MHFNANVFFFVAVATIATVLTWHAGPAACRWDRRTCWPCCCDSGSPSCHIIVDIWRAPAHSWPATTTGAQFAPLATAIVIALVPTNCCLRRAMQRNETERNGTRRDGVKHVRVRTQLVCDCRIAEPATGNAAFTVTIADAVCQRWQFPQFGRLSNKDVRSK